MTKAQANEIKSMITDAFIAEAKFLNKLRVQNCSYFVMTYNNDYCVCIDEGLKEGISFYMQIVHVLMIRNTKVNLFSCVKIH